MQQITIIYTKKEELDMDFLFAFTCKSNGKNYAVINNHEEIFENNSRYANLDILEIIETRGTILIASAIPENEWPEVKKSLQFEVFAKMN